MTTCLGEKMFIKVSLEKTRDIRVSIKTDPHCERRKIMCFDLARPLAVPEQGLRCEERGVQHVCSLHLLNLSGGGKQARKLQATLVRNYHSLADGGEV